jgi:hypothetical protein
LRQVVIGRAENGPLVPLSVVTGLEDPHLAVIIAVLQDHGAAHVDLPAGDRPRRDHHGGAHRRAPMMSASAGLRL